MNIHLTRKLRASIVAVSAASLTLIAPAFAGESRWKQHQNQQASASIPQFSELDQNNDQRLNQEELTELAQHQEKDAEQYIDQYDQDNNQALSEAEFQQLTSAEFSASSQSRMAALKDQRSEEQKPDGAQITVNQKPTQVTVDKPAPQITIEQPKPKVTITTQDPKVEVEQAEPRVSVTQANPEVSVDQAKPDVEVQDADPNVQISSSEPQVQVRQQEPQVDIQTAQQRASTEQQRLTSETRRQQMQQDRSEQMQADGARQQADAQQAIQSQEGIYAEPISELRNAEVVDKQGQAIGSVEEVVIRRDASEAGFIISTTGATGDDARHVYRSAEDFSVEDGQLKLDAEGGAEALNQPQGFVSQDFRAASESEGTLGELLRREGLSAR